MAWHGMVHACTQIQSPRTRTLPWQRWADWRNFGAIRTLSKDSAGSVSGSAEEVLGAARGHPPKAFLMSRKNGLGSEKLQT